MSITPRAAGLADIAPYVMYQGTRVQRASYDGMRNILQALGGGAAAAGRHPVHGRA